MSNTVGFGSLIAELPDGWLDVTDELPEGAPITLARQEGVGALQFTVAKYKSGARPNVAVADLKELLAQFAGSKGLGPPVEEHEGRGVHPYVSAGFRLDGETIRVWYVTNGRDVALVTYVAQDAETSRVHNELRDAARVIQTMRFL
jgi:hypothetical protein